METPDLIDVREKDLDKFDGPFLFPYNTDIHHCPNGNIYQDLISNEQFLRLASIKQLGTVGASSMNACQDQTRLYHSLVTAAMMDLVLYNTKLNDHERKLGIAAGLYHDIAILPFSDQGKLLNPGSYEEETLTKRLISNSAPIMQSLDKHNINLDELIETIKGNTIVGRILNSAKGIDIDNLSYLAIDSVWMCSSKYDDRRNLACEKGIFDQYRNIRYMNGEWVFDNPSLLTKLLKFRALMYERTYHNPVNRAKEAFMARLLKGNNIEPEEALNWTDSDFMAWVKRKLGQKNYENLFWILKEPFAEIGREYDITKLDQLKKEMEKEDIIVERLKLPRNATTNLVIYKKKIQQLEEIPEFRDKVEEVKRIIKRLDYIGIYKAL